MKMEERTHGCLPVRYVVTVLGCLGMITTYLLRTNINVTIVAMVKVSSSLNPDSAVACAELLQETALINTTFNSSFSDIQGEFLWDSNIQGMIFGSFFIGYLISQVPGGVLAVKFGGKRLVLVGVGVATVASFLIPLAARWNVWAVITIRFVQGFFEGFIFPAMNTLVSQWAPKMERSRIITLIYMGVSIGVVVSFTLSGVLSSSHFMGGWPSVFYVFGGIGGIWLVVWNTIVYEKPEDHPRITKEELLVINMERAETKTKSATPWKEIMTSLPVWALVITHFGQNCGFMTLVTELPTYMANVQHFDLKKNGVLSSTPHLLKALFGLVTSSIADYLRKNDYLQVTTIRKISNSFAFFGSGICILFVPFVGCQSGIVVILIMASMIFNSFMYSGFFCTHVDMSPQYAGILMGLTNCVANLGGFIVPVFTGKVVQSGQTLHNWSVVFITTAAVYFICGMIFNIFGSAELQSWNSPSPEPKKDETVSQYSLELADKNICDQTKF